VPSHDLIRLLYLLSADQEKAQRAEEIIRSGGSISVQVVNELASLAWRKLAMSPGEVLQTIREVLRVYPLTEESHAFGSGDCRAVSAGGLRCDDRWFGLARGYRDL